LGALGGQPGLQPGAQIRSFITDAAGRPIAQAPPGVGMAPGLGAPSPFGTPSLHAPTPMPYPPKPPVVTQFKGFGQGLNKAAPEVKPTEKNGLTSSFLPSF